MVTALLVGLGLGLVLAIPPGPIAIAILRQARAGQARAGVAMALGAAAMDSVSAGIAGWASWTSSRPCRAPCGTMPGGCSPGGGIVVLVGCGLRYLRTPAREVTAQARQEAQARTRSAASPTLLGVLLVLTHADQSDLPPHLTLSHKRRARPGAGWAPMWGRPSSMPSALAPAGRALVRLAPQNVDAAAGAALPPGPAQAVARGGGGHAPVRRNKRLTW